MTHPVEGLKPGSLAGQDLSLLKEGDLLSFDGEALFAFSHHQEDEEDYIVGAWLTRFGEGGPTFHPTSDGFAFIGRPDAEGWIAWTGGENPVPGTRVEVRYRDGSEAKNSPADEHDWSHLEKTDDIIAFRPVSTKPQRRPMEDLGDGHWVDVEPQGGDQGALQAQAPSVTTEGPQAAVVAGLREAFDYVCGLLPNGGAALEREADTYVLNCMVNVGELKRVKALRAALAKGGAS